MSEMESDLREGAKMALKVLEDLLDGSIWFHYPQDFEDAIDVLRTAIEKRRIGHE